VSSLGSLSHWYSQVSQLAEFLTMAASRIIRTPVSPAATESDEQIRERVALIARRLRRQLEDTDHGEGPQLAPLPAPFVEKVRAARRGELPYLLEDLEDLAGQVEHSTDALSGRAAAVLHTMVEAAVNEATTLYRRLGRH